MSFRNAGVQINTIQNTKCKVPSLQSQTFEDSNVSSVSLSQF